MKDLLMLLKLYSSISTKIHVLIRWYICPFSVMEKFIPREGKVLDVGCGEGIFSIYLALKSSKRKVLGIDLDSERINKAKIASKNFNNLEFRVNSAVSIKKKCNSIIISDAFHHFSKNDQIKFLKICSKVIGKNGVLLIKEINKSDLIRSKLSRLWDFLLYPEDEIRYWSKDNLSGKLISLGFDIKTKNVAQYFPGSTLLYICRKK